MGHNRGKKTPSLLAKTKWVHYAVMGMPDVIRLLRREEYFYTELFLDTLGLYLCDKGFFTFYFCIYLFFSLNLPVLLAKEEVWPKVCLHSSVLSYVV